MTLLILGIALWVFAHLFKRIAPPARAALTDRLGNAAKGVFAALILLSLVLIVIGYRGAEFVNVWYPPSFLGHVNNLLMLIAFYVYGIGMAKGALSQRVRHPMLTGTILWAVAHLLANGDLASIVLFGSMLAWAAVSIAMINAQEPRWTPPARKSGPRDLVAVGVVLVTYLAVGWIHAWLGVNPFGGV